MKRYQAQNKINIQNKKLKICNLNKKKLYKQKWKFLKYNLKLKTLKPEKKKEFFRERLYMRQYLKRFYGDLSKIELKKLLFNFLKKNKILGKNRYLDFFCLLETRLDIILVRLYIAKSIYHAKQLINHKKIKLNNKIINSNYYFLKEGDIISFNKLKIKKIKKNLNYIEYNVFLNFFIFIKFPKLKNISYPFSTDFVFFYNSIKNY